MRIIPVIALLFFIIGGCGAGKDAKTSAALLLEVGQVSADNVAIYDNGRTLAMGPMKMALGETDPATGEKIFTGRLGAPEPAGPKIVFVVKAISPEEKKNYKDHGIEMAEYTAYMLAENARLSPDALRDMTMIGRIGPAMTNDEIVALFDVEVPEPQWAPAPN